MPRQPEALSDRPSRLRWALGGLWSVLRQRNDRSRAGQPWPSRLFAAVGLVSVLPWLFVSVQLLRDDAPDGTPRSMVVVLAAQIAVGAAFVAAWLRWSHSRALLIASIASYAAASGFAAWDNDGAPMLAALIYAGVPALAAAPILLIGRTSRR